jgi:hypothetical protein
MDNTKRLLTHMFSRKKKWLDVNVVTGQDGLRAHDVMEPQRLEFDRDFRRYS